MSNNWTGREVQSNVYFRFDQHGRNTSNNPCGLISMAVTQVTIPVTYLNVSRICLGTWQFNDNKATNAWDAQSEKVRLIILNASF
jgi:hypothetical protein